MPRSGCWTGRRGVRGEDGLSAGGAPVHRDTRRHAVRKPGRALRARDALHPVLDRDVGGTELDHHGHRVRCRPRLMPNNFVTKWEAAAGIVAGVLTVTYVTV